MKNRIVRLSVLTQYLLSYLLVVLLPVSTMSFLFYRNFREQSMHRAQESQRYALTQLNSTMDSRLETLRHVALNISMDTKITPYLLQSYTYQKLEALEQLRRYRISMENYQMLAIYLHGGSMLYTDVGETSMTTFLNGTYQMNASWTQERFTTLLDSCVSLQSAPYDCYLKLASSGERYLIFLVPIPPTGNTYGTLLAFMPEDDISAGLADLQTDYAGISFIASEDGTVLYTGGTGFSASMDELSALAINGAFIDGEYTVAGVRVLLVHTKSDNNGWSYVSIIPVHQYDSGWSLLSKSAWFVPLAILTVVSLLISIALSWLSYNPIRRIDRQFNMGKSTEHNELNRIHNVISQTIDNNRMLNKQLEMERPYLTRAMLSDLLCGTLTATQQEMNDHLRVAQMHLKGPYAVLVLKEELGDGNMAAVISLINDIYLQTVYALKLPYSNVNAVLLDLNHDGTLLDQLPEQITEAVHDQLGVAICVGVSNQCENLAQLNRALMEAESAMQYFRPDAQYSVRRFGDIQNTIADSDISYPTQSQLRLLTALRYGNEALAEEALAEIERHLASVTAKGAQTILRHILADIVNSCVRFFQECDFVKGAQWAHDLMSAPTQAATIRELHKICSQICETVSLRKQEDREKLFDTIIKDIHENFNNANLSLGLIAEKYNMSLPQLSRFFKENANMNFIDYVSNLRIQRACKLLKETDLRIGDISRMIGYTDQSSFTRKFIQMVGVSPGRYR